MASRPAGTTLRNASMALSASSSSLVRFAGSLSVRLMPTRAVPRRKGTFCFSVADAAGSAAMRSSTRSMTSGYCRSSRASSSSRVEMSRAVSSAPRAAPAATAIQITNETVAGRQRSFMGDRGREEPFVGCHSDGPPRRKPTGNQAGNQAGNTLRHCAGPAPVRQTHEAFPARPPGGEPLRPARPAPGGPSGRRPTTRPASRAAVPRAAASPPGPIGCPGIRGPRPAPPPRDRGRG